MFVFVTMTTKEEPVNLPFLPLSLSLSLRLSVSHSPPSQRAETYHKRLETEVLTFLSMVKENGLAESKSIHYPLSSLYCWLPFLPRQCLLGNE